MNKKTLSIIKKSIASALIFSLGFGTAYTLNLKESPSEAGQKEIVKIDKQYIENGNQIFELSDGSFYLINNETGKYIFQAVDLGDWDYEVENKEQLENIVNTYISMKNTGKY